MPGSLVPEMELLSKAPFHPHPALVASAEFILSLLKAFERAKWSESCEPAKEFLSYLRENPQFKKHLQNCLKTLFSESSCVDFLRGTGMPGDRGFWGDVLSWVKYKLVPLNFDHSQIDFFWQMLADHKISLKWMKKIPAALEESFLEEISLLAHEQRTLWRALRWQVCDAMELLASQVFTVANSTTMSRIRGVRSLPSTPFFEFKKVFEELMSHMRYHSTLNSDLVSHPEQFLPQFKKLRETLIKCNEDVQALVSLFEETGASIDAISRVEQLRVGLGRLEKLSMTLLLPTKKYSVLSFCAYLTELKTKEGSFSFLAARNFNILSKKVVEHAGTTGEHYVANTKKETLRMFYTSFGAGTLTVATCIIKFEIGALKAPPLADFLMTALNYSLSFTFFHFLGLTLATKQPSATASHLAHSLHLMEKNEIDQSPVQNSNYDPAILLFSRIVRTQFVAVIGNLSAVIPAALLFSFFVSQYLNQSVLSVEKASKTISNFSIASPTLLLFGAMTGVLLWFASLVTGWVQNWIVFNRVSLPKFAERNFAGVVSSVCLGFLLALPAFLGSLVGFAWDVRHVTLGAGSVVFSLFTLWEDTKTLPFSSFSPLYEAFLGVFLVGFLNVFVSFGCALFLALRALKLQAHEVFRVFWRTALTILKNPLLFFKL